MTRFYGWPLKRAALAKGRTGLELRMFVAGNRVGLVGGCNRNRVLGL